MQISKNKAFVEPQNHTMAATAATVSKPNLMKRAYNSVKSGIETTKTNYAFWSFILVLAIALPTLTIYGIRWYKNRY